MKFFDENGKVLGRFNALDVGVFVVVLVLCLGTVLKFTSVSAGTKKDIGVQTNTTVTYKVELEQVRDYFNQNVQLGDILYDLDSQKPIGEIVDIQVDVSEIYLDLFNGEVEMASYDNRYDVTLTIEGQGVKNDKGYFVDKTYEILVGSTRNFYTKYSIFQAKIVDLIK